MNIFGNLGASTSEAGELNSVDWAKNVRTWVLTAGSAAVGTFFLALISQLQTGQVDLGAYAWLTPVLITVLTGLSDLVNRYTKNNQG
jgi:hypothetical protein